MEFKKVHFNPRCLFKMAISNLFCPIQTKRDVAFNERLSVLIVSAI